MIWIVVLVLAIGLIWSVLVERISTYRHLSRLTDEQSSSSNILKSKFVKTLDQIGKKQDRRKLGKTLSEGDLELNKKFSEAGLDHATSIGAYFVFKISCYILGPIISASGYLFLSTYHATLLTLVGSIFFLFLPQLVLKMRTRNRKELMQRELPLLIDLTNLGTSAGWDIASSLERVIDALYLEMPGHPLITEYKRGRRMVTTGYSWHEILGKISERLDHDSVKRCNLALAQAIKQGGDRTSQLDGIASDAQRMYYAELDQKLAALPVKAVLITMVLMITYVAILMVPAMITIKQTMG